MIFGLAAALGWGLADITVTVASRRIGSFFSVVLAQFAGTALFVVLLIAAHPPMPAPGAVRLIVLLIAGVSGALSYLAFYRGLQLGPIALVTPIVAGYSAIVIGLSLAVLHESVAALALTGASVTLAGVVLASTDVQAIRLRIRSERGGAFYAVLAMFGFGIGAFVIGSYARDLGWFEAVFISHIGSTIALLALLAGRRDWSGLRVGTRFLGAVAVAGVVDILAFASFARGSELGHEAITAAASAVYPLIPVLTGVFFLRERPAPVKWIGVALVIAGLLLLAVGR
jgi:drug/metabolite transporter (DMT)-like permease